MSTISYITSFSLGTWDPGDACGWHITHWKSLTIGSVAAVTYQYYNHPST